ncbi:MAG: DUF1573 domain-containing protein [Saprospiraceae bacterium]|nr:DUF1573 domain-containing protein [Saprospiraceae bacterium]
MKQTLTLFVLMLFASMALIAQQSETKEDQKKETTEEAVDGPKLTLDKSTVDYGEIEHGSDPLRVVSFTNTGNAPLIISNAKGSCGCTVPTWPREPIAPGESAEIEIRYDTKRTGPINKTVRLTTNDATGQYTIRVTGRVKAKVQEEGLPEKEGIFKPGSGN